MVLLGEAVRALTWGLGLVIVGLLLVKLKQEAKEEPPILEEADDDDLAPGSLAPVDDGVPVT